MRDSKTHNENDANDFWRMTVEQWESEGVLHLVLERLFVFVVDLDGSPPDSSIGFVEGGVVE